MNLASWLQTIQALHPVAIDLGLDRVRQVADAMGLGRPAPLVVTVGGTNGKGSCVALLQQILLAAGYRVGSYTSPHIHCYNERLLFNGTMASDEQLCRSFEQVAQFRGEVSLTYFEYGTLAALWLMQQEPLDVAILEVGLGGRLDAVNIIDADFAVIGQIALDHMDWLGPDRDSIGREKAGIFRPGATALCSDPSPPHSMVEQAQRLGTPFRVLGHDYGFDLHEAGQWSWWGRDRGGQPLTLSRLPATPLATDHAATIVQLVQWLPLPVTRQALETGLATARLPGRWELLRDPREDRQLLLDVAHNPAAAERLAGRLASEREVLTAGGKVAAVLAIMADKDVEGFCRTLASAVNIWYIAQVAQPRAMPAEKLAALLDKLGLTRFPIVFADPAAAYQAAVANTAARDLILVTGSFFTVAAVRGHLTGLGTG